MRQVLFFIPTDAIPNIQLFLVAIAIVLAIAVACWRQRIPKLVRYASYAAAILLGSLAFLKRLGAVLGTDSIPIYGYGAMLFLAFVFCVLLAAQLGKREGIEPKVIQDLAIWIFIFGIVGARVTYMIQYRESIWSFFMIWNGGLVWYGGAIGGAVGYFFANTVFKYRISSWKFADVVAPCAALGLALGRVGCLLNGCCYGNVACAEWRAIEFPLSAPPRFDMTERGFQTAAGFTLDPKLDRTVGAVEPDSSADRAGLRTGDIILQINGKDVGFNGDIEDYLKRNWPRGKNDLSLVVRHANSREPQELVFSPMSIGLHPTQIYETISMILLAFLLLAYYPFKRHDGSLMVLFMIGYAVHRFLNEMLRTDTKPVAFGMTLSQNISIMVLIAGILLGIVVRSRPMVNGPETPAPADGTQGPQAPTLAGGTQ